MFGAFSSGGFGSTPQPTFGQPATTGGFGAQPTTGFGAQPTSTFGSTPSFGQPSATPGFGQPTSTFGAPATQPTTGFGGFGATTPGFGATTPSTGFGATQPSFGQPAPSTGGFGFGASTTPAPAFGASTTSTFGQPSTTGGMFGQPSTTGGMFGASSTPSMFGGPSTTAPTSSPFGATTTTSAFGTGGFGSTQPSGFGASVGTGNPPYKTSPDTDTGNNGQPLQHTAITAMAAYQNKSFEELRFEDYSSKKGSLGTGTTPGFGATTTTPSPFGTSAPSASPFGASTTTPAFGATTTQPSSTGFGFGSTTSTTPSTGFGFGATTNPAPTSTTGFGFGATQPTATQSPFGATSTQPSSTGFGFGASSTPSPFGATATTTPSPFGATTTQPTSTGFGFGASATPSPFGASTAPRPATTPTTGGFGFGATSAPTTTPTTTGFGFGTTAPTSSSLFGAQTTPTASTGGFGFGTTPSATTAPTTSLFGATPTPTTAPSTGTSSFGSFGFGTTPTTAPSTTGPSLFGGFGATTAPSTTTAPNFSFTPASPAPASGGFGNFGATSVPTLGTTGRTTSISSPSPFGTVPPPISPAVTAPPQPSIVPVTPTARKPPMTPSHYQVTPKSAAKIKPRGYASAAKTKPLFEEAPAATPDFFVTRTSIKKLNIEPEEESEMAPKTPGGSFLLTPSRADVTMTSPQATPLAPRTLNTTSSTPLTASLLKPVATKGHVQFKTLNSIKTHTEDLNELPSLTREGYYTIPDLKTLSQYTTDQLSSVEDFVIGLRDVGSVLFLDPVDVRGLDLDKIIEFSIGEIVVYPDEHNKPEVGQGINRPARVTLEHLWPMDRASNRRKLDEDSLNRYEHKIIKSTERLGARFLSYDRKTGNWTFEVEHFSRYGLLEDSDDEEDAQPPVQQPVPPSPGRFKLEIENSDDSQTEESEEEQREEEEEEEEQEMEENEEEEEEEERAMILSSSEAMNERLPEQLGLDANRMQVMKSFLFDDTLASKRKSLEQEIIRKSTPKKDIQLVPERPLPLQPLFPELVPKAISAPLQYVPSSVSAFPQSFSMHRSFRVGWGPNGTFIHPGRALGNVTMKKVFVAPQDHDVAQQYAPMLEDHYESSIYTGNSPSGVPTFQLQNVYENVKKNIIQMEEAKSENIMWANVLEQSKLVFQLVSALWGQDTSAEEVFTGFEIKSDETYAETIARRLALNYWLKNTVQPSILRDLHFKSGLDAIFSLMSGKQISEAAIKAIEQKDYRLATLLAQACSNGSLRSDLKFQLESWTNSGLAEKIDAKRWKLYRLLSGDVNGVVGEIDWKRAFAMQYWYSSANNATISQVIENYDRCVTKNCCRSPLPGYVEAQCNELPGQVNMFAVTENGESYMWNEKSTFKLNNFSSWKQVEKSEMSSKTFMSISPIGMDTNYHLMKLRADQTYDMWRVVAPNSSSPFALDYRLSWHLLSVMTTLGYQSVEEYHKVFMNYVFQLESAGLWHWSIYVLLHLPQHEEILKENAIRSILARHANELFELREEFLLDKLHIPSEWIEEAKSYCTRNPHDEIFFILRSKQWNRAHDLILNVLAPELILKGKLDQLYDLLVPLREHYKQVIDWELGGNIYYEYITISRDVKNCVAMANDPNTTETAISHVPELEMLVTSLCKRLSAFIVKRERDNVKTKRLSERVCLTDMSAQLAVYLKELRKFMAVLKQESEDREMVQLTSSLTSMDVPEDYKLLHLRELQKSYLRVKVSLN